MERIADNETITEMIVNEEDLTATREDGLEESFTMSYRNEAKLRAFLSVNNQQKGRTWLVKDEDGNIIKAPSIEINKPVILKLPW